MKPAHDPGCVKTKKFESLRDSATFALGKGPLARPSGHSASISPSALARPVHRICLGRIFALSGPSAASWWRWTTGWRRSIGHKPAGWRRRAMSIGNERMEGDWGGEAPLVPVSTQWRIPGPDYHGSSANRNEPFGNHCHRQRRSDSSIQTALVQTALVLSTPPRSPC